MAAPALRTERRLTRSSAADRRASLARSARIAVTSSIGMPVAADSVEAACA
jgi:hypothetical protein